MVARKSTYKNNVWLMLLGMKVNLLLSLTFFFSLLFFFICVSTILLRVCLKAWTCTVDSLDMDAITERPPHWIVLMLFLLLFLRNVPVHMESTLFQNGCHLYLILMHEGGLMSFLFIYLFFYVNGLSYCFTLCYLCLLDLEVLVREHFLVRIMR